MHKVRSKNIHCTIFSISEVPGVGCCSNKHSKMWKWLWNWVMGRGLKSFEMPARKSFEMPARMAMNRPLGVILMRAMEKASILLSNPEQNVVEIEMEKAILMKS